MFEGFIHPGLAIGTLLAVVPLAIHLLNRQRHRPLPWAAMRFVMAAYRRTRRRAQLENLLLLLLRMGAVALLALAIARPFTGKDSPLAPWTETRRELALVLDGSASTGYREGTLSVHDRIISRGREVLGGLDGARGDRVRLIYAAAKPELLPTRSPEDALGLLSTLDEPTAEELDLPAALAEVLAMAEEQAAGTGTSTLEVRLLTDLQRRAFSPWQGETPPEANGEGEAPTPLFGLLDRLDELGVTVVVEDLGATVLTPPNLGVDSIRPLTPILGAGIATEIGVRILNHGTETKGPVRVALSIDGERLPSRTIEIGARSSAEAVFPVVFSQSGFHTLEVELEGDRLAVDDSRSRVVHVPPATRILLVNGDPRENLDEDEVGYWRTVLEPTGDDSLGTGYAPFRASTVTVGTFESAPPNLELFDVILLANVGSLSPRTFKQLEERVAAGATLIITLGDRDANATAIESWNVRGWHADGTGLLPARLLSLTEVRSRREAYYRVREFDREHPVLSFFADERWQPLLTEVPIYAFVTSEPIAGARVLATLDDIAKSALLVERPYDRGRVLLWTTSIDAAWNRIPESPGTLVPLVHELMRYAGRSYYSPRNLGIGHAFTAEVQGFPRNAVLASPDDIKRPLIGEPESVSADLWRLPPVEDTRRRGVYRIELEGAEDVVFSINIESAEGNLDRITPAELEGSHRAWRIFAAEEGSRSRDEQRPERGELWRWLAALALAFLIAETLWAAWIGRGRRLS